MVFPVLINPIHFPCFNKAHPLSKLYSQVVKARAIPHVAAQLAKSGAISPLLPQPSPLVSMVLLLILVPLVPAAAPAPIVTYAQAVAIQAPSVPLLPTLCAHLARMIKVLKAGLALQLTVLGTATVKLKHATQFTHLSTMPVYASIMLNSSRAFASAMNVIPIFRIVIHVNRIPSALLMRIALIVNTVRMEHAFNTSIVVRRIGVGAA
jgi:hypothetical protein